MFGDGGSDDLDDIDRGSNEAEEKELLQVPGEGPSTDRPVSDDS